MVALFSEVFKADGTPGRRIMADVVRISISLDERLLERLEALVQASGYTNRSEYVRDLVRKQLVEREWDENRDVVGTITLVFDHETRELAHKLTHVQHHHHNAILATTHVHLDTRLCVETILVRGPAGEIQALADHLGQQKGVLHASLSVSSTGRDLV